MEKILTGEGAILGFEPRTALGEQGFEVRGGDGCEAVQNGAGADGGQQFLGVFGKQDEGGVLGGLFEDFKEGVGRLAHEGGGGEDGERAFGLDRRPVVGDVDDLADLADLDEQLRRVGGDDEDVGVGLDEDAGLALVGLAQVFACFDGLGYKNVQVGRITDAEAVAAFTAEVGQTIAFSWVEAVDGLSQHQGQRIFARSARPGQDQRVGKSPGADALAKMGDGGRVAEKILKAHGLSLEHLRVAL